MFLSGPARGSSRFSRGSWVTPQEMENESLDQSVFTNIMRHAGN